MIAEILPGNLWLVIKFLPLLGITALLFGLFGWWLRRKFHAPDPIPAVGTEHPHDTNSPG